MPKFISTASLIGLAACATPGSAGSEPLSIEFGQDVYLAEAFLQSTPDVHCGPPTFAPGGNQVRAALPDGSWFRLFAIDSSTGGPDTVILERGWADQEAQLTMRLDSEEGIVRLLDRGQRDAWGINHPWADWMRALGTRVLSLECARPDAPSRERQGSSS